MKRNIIKASVLPLLALMGLAMASCTDGDDFNYNKKGIFVTGTETDPMTKFVVEGTPATFTVTAQTTKKVENDVKVTFAIDTTLVSAYNEKNQSSFYPIPAGCAEIENPEVTISAGTALSSGAQVKVTSTSSFQEGRTYLIPVTIKSVSNTSGEEIIESSRTVYLKVSRIIQFTSLVNDYSFSSNYIFPDDKIATLTNFTFEIKVRADRFGSSGGSIERVCAWEEKDESNASMLRFGEAGYDGNQLQWVSPAGSVVSSTRFTPNQWYLISLVYDGSSMTMYVNGVKDASINASGITVKFQRFELGMSWGGYNYSQFFPGRFAEVRVWNRALSTNEMQNGLGSVDPHSSGLVAYWKMNEGEGHIFHDSTGNGYDMDWNDTYRADYEGDLIHHTDYGDKLKWANDENNKYSE